tara:strand:+ start:2494 stop:4338 length:1845 start_codon:yes stop_codon:yes gene_type:complete
MAKYTVELEVDSKGAVKSIEEVNEALLDTSKAAKKQSQTAQTGVTNIGKSSKKAATGGVAKLTTGFRVLGGVMKAAGIGLIITALTFLYSTIKENQDIMDVLNTGFEALSIVGGEVSRVLVSVITQVSKTDEGFAAFGVHIENMIKLVLAPFKVAIKGIELAMLELERAQAVFDFDKEKVTELTKEITKTQKAILDLGVEYVTAYKDVIFNIPDLIVAVGTIADGVIKGVSDIDLAVVLSTAQTNIALNKTAALAVVTNAGLIEEYNRLAEKQRQIRDNVLLSVDDRIAANNLLKVELEKQNELMIKNAKIVKAAAQAQYDKTKSDADNIILQQAKNDLLAIEAQTTGFLSEQKVNESALLKEKMDLDLINDEATSLRQNELKLFNAEMDEQAVTRLETLLANLEIENTAETLRLTQKKALFNEGTQAYVDANNELLDYQQQNANQQTQIGKELEVEKGKQLKKGLQDVISIVGANSKFGKAVAIAAAIQDTYAGANKALAQGGIYGFIGAAAIISGGIANVKKITSTKPPEPPTGLRGGGASASVATPSIPSAASIIPNLQTPDFDILGASQGNQIAQALGQQSPVQAFVVAQDVTSAQSLQNNIITGATLGG